MDKISTIEQGKEELARIALERQQLLFAMQHEGNIHLWKQLADERYKLKKLRNNIQSQMLKLASEKINNA